MKAFMRFAFVLATAVGASAPAFAQDTDTPDALAGVRVVSVAEARGLIGSAAFFDVRPSISYGRGHIKSASTLPYEERSAKSVGFDPSEDHFDVKRLPKDKAMPIVFYGDGRTGWKSYKAAAVASRAGYSNVKWLRVGTAGWIEAGGRLE
jgi:rhodanese-related sulfurtransferase